MQHYRAIHRSTSVTCLLVFSMTHCNGSKVLMTICMYLLVVLTDMTGTLLVYLTQWGHDLGNTNKWVEGFSPKISW